MDVDVDVDTQGPAQLQAPATVKRVCRPKVKAINAASAASPKRQCLVAASAKRQRLVAASGVVSELPGWFAIEVQAGDMIEIETPGGGGFGPAGDIDRA